MKILLVGNRAIQHALSARLTAEGATVCVYPGQELPFMTSLSANDVAQHSFDFVVNGSARYFDDPVVQGLRNAGVPVIGPTREIGVLETSKVEFDKFARCAGLNRPRTSYLSPGTDLRTSLSGFDSKIAVKVAGPARGCGVTIVDSPKEALAYLELEAQHGVDEYVIEEFIEGFEIGINVMVRGDDFLVLPPTLPHKDRFDGNRGPKVAGMGSVAPVELNSEFFAILENRIVRPTLDLFRRQGIDYCGCLFINLMVTPDLDVFVLEYNCRMGDPAMVANLFVMQSSLCSLLAATASGGLDTYRLESFPGFCTVVTHTRRDYPNDQHLPPESFSVDRGLVWDGRRDSGVVFSAARETGCGYQTTGGVVCLSAARSSDFGLSQRMAYSLAGRIPSLDCRSDIGSSIAGERPYPFGL